MKILVTGAAGFIGYHVVLRLLADEHHVIGLDNINDYYDVDLKYGRLYETGIERRQIKEKEFAAAGKFARYRFIKMDITDQQAISSLFAEQKFDRVCHLAAQVGVRYSINQPQAYIDSNIVGFGHILEACRQQKVARLIYASSSSVYGLNKKMPFSSDDTVDQPISMYAASKKSNELMAHVYSQLFGLSTIGLRFFTVYGPWGRPDMAPVIFAKKITDGRPIDVFNHGNMRRDFTYIDDVVEGVVMCLIRSPRMEKVSSDDKIAGAQAQIPYKIYNIGNGSPVNLLDFIKNIEKVIGKTARKNMCPMQPGDVAETYADLTTLTTDFDYRPSTDIESGVKKFINWFNAYYNLES